ncbi:membrane-spanning 4-domains subfamily A member 14-like isoform X2 [Acipenser ruthenus]|uniref:membrane-spanning 4-domains subfamily A member 14-like isoform X2 n=1 Tax=Acipenser ruthenus TaxID=7906 RepID=UPI0027419B63|nr:membrane-spanning 4-domains subfamily A member 14-like isoform X2 [Acipenser ruthenus]
MHPLPEDRVPRPVLGNIHLKKAVKNDGDDDEDYIFKIFLKRKPKTLGAVQIMIAIVTLGSGVLLTLSPPSLVMVTRIPFGTSLMFLISGALSIAVERFRPILQVSTAEIKGLLCALAVLEMCITAALLQSRFKTSSTTE